MIESKYNDLDDVHKQLFIDVAANHSYKFILELEKKEIESFILQLRRKDNDTDASCCRRYADLQIKLSVLQELIDLNKTVLKNIKPTQGVQQ